MWDGQIFKEFEGLFRVKHLSDTNCTDVAGGPVFSIDFVILPRGSFLLGFFRVAPDT